MKKILSVALIVVFMTAFCVPAFALSFGNSELSREWVAENCSDLVADIQLMADPACINDLFGLPSDMAIALAEEYAAEPALLVHFPSNSLLTGLVTDAAAFSLGLPDELSDITSDFMNLLEMTLIYSRLNASDIYLMGAVSLTKYMPCDRKFDNCLAFYPPVDGDAGKHCIMLDIRWDEGIAVANACFMPWDVYAELLDSGSELIKTYRLMGADIVLPDKNSRQFVCNTALPAELPVLDDALLEAKAREIANIMLLMANTPEFFELFSAPDEIAALCAAIGTADVENSEAIISRDIDGIASQMELADIDAELMGILQRYYSSSSASFELNYKVSSYGTNFVAASAILNYSSQLFYADADFDSYIVYLKCSGEYSVAVGFGKVADGIVKSVAFPIPTADIK